MSRYVDIFKEIVDIIHNDYSGYKVKRNWDNPTYFIGKIENLNGELQTFKLKDYELISTNLKPSLEEINEETVLVSLPSFFNVDRNLEYIEDVN